MTPRSIRNKPGRKENLAAALVSAGLATGIALVAFYFTRLFLARDSVGGDRAPEREDAGPAGG